MSSHYSTFFSLADAQTSDGLRCHNNIDVFFLLFLTQKILYFLSFRFYFYCIHLRTFFELTRVAFTKLLVESKRTAKSENRRCILQVTQWEKFLISKLKVFLSSPHFLSPQQLFIVVMNYCKVFHVITWHVTDSGWDSWRGSTCKQSIVHKASASVIRLVSVIFPLKFLSVVRINAIVVHTKYPAPINSVRRSDSSLVSNVFNLLASFIRLFFLNESPLFSLVSCLEWK